MPIEFSTVPNSCESLKANASVCDTFWRLADFQELGANPVFALFMPPRILSKPFDWSSTLSGHSQLQGFWCQYSLTFFTACADCSNLSLTHTYIHKYIQTYRQTDRHTDRQTDRQTDRLPGFRCQSSLALF